MIVMISFLDLTSPVIPPLRGAAPYGGRGMVIILRGASMALVPTAPGIPASAGMGTAGGGAAPAAEAAADVFIVLVLLSVGGLMGEIFLLEIQMLGNN